MPTVITGTDGINQVQAGAVEQEDLFAGFVKGITEDDQWILTADLTSNADPISANLERSSVKGFEKIGIGMSVSSGIWSFPSTGLWLVRVHANITTTSGDFMQLYTGVSDDGGSSYDRVSAARTANTGTAGGSSIEDSSYSELFVNVTNISNYRLKFFVDSINSGSALEGATNGTKTTFTFVRLGDAQ